MSKDFCAQNLILILTQTEQTYDKSVHPLTEKKKLRIREVK